MKVRIDTKAPTWHAAAALACFISSALSLGIGFILTTGWFVNADRHPFLHGLGITLLIIGIPILILGGHCLDLMERKRNTGGVIKEMDLDSVNVRRPAVVIVDQLAHMKVPGSKIESVSRCP
ncbi:MAG TPA: hypothetical protein VFH31_06450 [Pyrinomonadaceae bacterium]|nr:hypothetical protein [Pyrinomonadaceae bacterium]